MGLLRSALEKGTAIREEKGSGMGRMQAHGSLNRHCEISGAKVVLQSRRDLAEMDYGWIRAAAGRGMTLDQVASAAEAVLGEAGGDALCQ